MTFSAAQPVMPSLEEQEKANTPPDTDGKLSAEVEGADTGPGSADDDEKEADRHERAVVAAAMRLLQHARKRSARTDSADDDGYSMRVDAGGRLDKASRTSLGGAIVSATLGRVGVVKYRMKDGSVRSELRPPEEVFSPESLKTLRGAPVTVGHPYEIGGLLDAGTYRKFTVGHTEDIRQDGSDFLAGNLFVQDGKTGDSIDRGDLYDISPGYQCKHDPTPGVWNGQPYDVIQRGIRYNHIALLPPGTSRADIGLRLDANDAVGIAEEKEQLMTTKIKLDGKDFDFGSEAHIEKIEAMHSATVTKLDEKLTEKKDALKALIAEKDGLQGKHDDLSKRLDEAKAALAAATDPKALAEKVNARVQLVVKAKSVLGDEAKLDDKSDRDIMVDVIKLDAKEFDAEGKSDDYIRGRFESVEKSTVRTDSVDAIVRTIETSKRLDQSDMSEVTKAQLKMYEARDKAYLGIAAK